MEADKQEKTIKDYLHLYLGCDVQYPDTDGSIVTATFTGFSRADGVETTYKKKPKKGEAIGDYLAWKENGHHNSTALNLKPILRRLSSITDDEIKELFHYEKVRHEYKDISFDRWTVENRTTGVITLTGITMNYTIPTDEGDHARSYTIEVSGMNAYDFKWCLSKGFDIFGLIDVGLAIQKPLPL